MRTQAGGWEMQDCATVVVDVKLLEGDPVFACAAVKLGTHCLGHAPIPALTPKISLVYFVKDWSKEFLPSLYLAAHPWGIQMENFACGKLPLV